MPKLELWHKVLLFVGLLFAAFFFCNREWNEDAAIAEVKFIAMTNQERYLIDKLDRLCQSYGFHKYPCPTDRMKPQDRVNYRHAEEWYKDQRRQIKGFFGGKRG